MIVPPSDVAVIVQGPVAPATPALLGAIRLHLPGARVVLSTWEGTELDGLDADEVVLRSDPGALSCTTTNGIAGPPINTNRMITSTLAGVRRAERPWTVKLRTDALVEHGGVLRCLAQLPASSGEWSIFERLVGVSSVYTRNPVKTPAGSYHPADTIQFGRTSDLLTLWDVPHMSAADANHWPDPATRPAWSLTSQRYYPEQWVFVSALRTRHVVDFEHRADNAPSTIERSNRALVQNFMVAEPWQIGIRVPHLEEQLRWGEDPVCVMIQPTWQQLRDASLARTDRTGRPPAVATPAP